MNQVENGKAFEYALAMGFKKVTKAPIKFNSSFQIAESFYNLLNDSKKRLLDLASIEAAVFLQLHDKNIRGTKTIILQEDSVGIKGDVRDIILETPENPVGVSAKHNHNAIKHPRLSNKIDFGKEWTRYPCSSLYFNETKPIFDYLAELRNKKMLFRDIDDKENRIYLPILKAFSKELQRLCFDYQDKFVKSLFQYIIGSYDFYKVIVDTKSKQKQVIIQSFNLNGTLGYGRKWRIPSRILSLEIKPESKNKLIIIFEDGWSISFRIHSASSKVESSLKFDIQFVGLSSQVISHQIPVV
ncbi:HaeIII family restriction endonuclease [Bartonella machadoae]|uniref:HaeIII family restriction endonuclease n=1 Tax=Bartonella machadoae TaxID=2893471 RepID=UPI001F4CA34F|nr:HaeIII family restriction endonuclease [Bartonella machadoae]UNE54067.1 HaeIII family restriction endonuclease [Bartonella machadoae]